MRFLLPVAAIFYLVLALVAPAVRLRRKTGSFGLAVLDGKADRGQRVISFCLAVCVAAMLAWTAAYSVGVVGLFIWSAPYWVAGLGWMCVVLGALCTLVAQAQMGSSWRVGIDASPTELVTTGLYAVVRNPIFTGVLLTLMGVVLITPAVWSILIWAAVFVLVNVQVRAEERHLAALHGARYWDYASRAGRFLPRL